MTENPQQDGGTAQQRPASLADMVSVPEGASFRLSFPPSTLVKVLVLGGLVLGMNWRQFPMMVREWIDDPNWSHGFLIPLFSVYLLYSRRHELLSARRRTCLWGLPLLILACVFQILGYWVHNPWSCQVGMTVLLFGLVLYLGGGELAKVTWLPIFFLVFAMPIPEIVYREIAYPLQKLAAHGSAAILKVFGVMIRATESSLQIISRSGKLYTPTVADACSGMRLLMAFLALGVAMAYLHDRPGWQRAVLLLSTVPIAIFCNMVRVTVTGFLYVLVDPRFTQGIYHDLLGLAMLPLAFGLYGLLAWFMASLFVEEGEQAGAGVIIRKRPQDE